MAVTPSSTDVLRFWFEEIPPAAWWRADAAFDRSLDARFGALHAAARQGELWTWRDSPAGRLAEVIVLDQFSRNLLRGTPMAFAQDPMALALAQEAVARGTLDALATPQERTFLLMPGMHSESRAVHAWVEPLFRRFTPAENHGFEQRHRAIIERFGRYPHRNAILGRASTAEELAFLETPGASF